MNLFSTNISNNKIELTIPKHIMKDAKRVFKHLKRTSVADVYEVPESAENVAKCIQLEALLFAKKNRKPADASSMRAYLEHLANQSANKVEIRRESLPEVQPKIMTVKEAVEICPALADAISCVVEMKEENDFEVGAVCIPAGTIPSSLIADGGPVLLFDMNKSGTALFADHVCAVPEPVRFLTLDLKERPSANGWTIYRGPQKMPGFYGVDLGLFEYFYTPEQVGGRELERARIAIRAGDHIAFGGHFRDDAIAKTAISYLIDFSEAPVFSKVERQSAAEALAKHGRTPWLGNFFPGKTTAAALVPVARPEVVIGRPDVPRH